MYIDVLIPLHQGISKIYDSTMELDRNASISIINVLTVSQVPTPGSVTQEEKDARMQAINKKIFLQQNPCKQSKYYLSRQKNSYHCFRIKLLEYLDITSCNHYLLNILSESIQSLMKELQHLMFNSHHRVVAFHL